MNKTPVSEKLYRELLTKIKSDSVSVGDRLPTEQALCAEYGVGRSTVREVARTLQAKGYVEIKRGSGVYVVSKEEYASERESKWLIDNKESIVNYMNVRMAIEELAVTLFIQQFNKKQFKDLLQIEEQFEKAVESGDVDKMVDMDKGLHGAIAKGTHNPLLISINRQLEETFETYRFITFSKAEHRKEAINAHRRILESIHNRDTNNALYNMRSHLRVSIDNAIKQAGL
jgi:GntR family transcriptional repressor for pyruvate dehydrogenase complex